MPFPDLHLSIPFIIFLLMFIVLGIYPVWKKTTSMIGKALKGMEQSEAAANVQFQEQPNTAAAPHTNPELTDFESFVLCQLAQNQPKSLTRKKLNSNLHLEPVDLKSALRSLADQGLIYMEISSLFRFRYRLSDSGYQYAIERGFIAPLHTIPGI